MGCNDFSHLNNCEDFICPKDLVKCPFSYCIPFHYVNDLVMDCRYGEDESSAVGIADNSLKRCLKNNPTMRICDGKTECDDFADELDCHSYCAAGFKCQAGVVIVDDYNKSEAFIYLFRFDGSTKVFFLSGVNLSSISNARIQKFNRLFELHLSDCSLNEDSLIEFVEKDPLLYLVDLSYNNIKKITENGMFSKLINLQMINISHNMFLETIDPGGIVAKKIIYLDLSQTMISFLPNSLLKNSTISQLFLQHTKVHSLDWLPMAFKLNILNLKNTPLYYYSIQNEYFKNATIKVHLLVDHFALCCPLITGQGIPSHVCQSPYEPVSSCKQLINDFTKKILLWIMGIISIVGNVIVFIYSRANLYSYSGICTANLAISDFLMGIYLIVIVSVDVFYQGTYALFERYWRHSALCKLSGFLSTLSSEASIFFVFLLNLDQCSTMISSSFKKNCKNLCILPVSITSAWAYGLFISLLPLIFSDWTIYSANGMCRRLPLVGDRDSGWMYAVTTLAILKFAFVIFLAFSLVALYKFIKCGNKTSVCTSYRRGEIDLRAARQLFFITLTHFLCWFPISVLGLKSFNGQVVSHKMYAWLITIILPLNSAVNPMVFTVPMIYKKWVEFKKGVNNFPLKDCFTKPLDLLIVLDSWEKELPVVKQIVKYFTDRPAKVNGWPQLRLAVLHADNMEPVLHFHRVTDYSELNKNGSYETQEKVNQRLISNNDLDKCVSYFDINSLISNTTRLAIWIIRCEENICSHKLDQGINTTRYFASHELNILFLVFTNGNLHNFAGYLNNKNILKLVERSHIRRNQLGIKLCGKCKSGWVHYKSKRKPIIHSCYFVGGEHILKKELSEDACRRDHSTLVNIETNEELFFLQELLSKELHLRQLKKGTREILIHTGLESDKFYWSNKRPILISNKYMPKIADGLEDTLKNYSSVLHVNQTHITIGREVARPISPVYNKFIALCEEFVGQFSTHNNQSEQYKDHDLKLIDFLFECRDSSSNYIHYNEVCDGVIHCENNLDEEYCYNDNGKKEKVNQFQCKKHNFDFPSVKTIDIISVCDRKLDCIDGSDENDCPYCVDEIKCSDGTCLPKHWLDERNDNCQFNLSIYLDDKNGTYPRQLEYGVTNCDAWNSTWAPRCVHLRDNDGRPIGCLDKSHLENGENFTCSTGLAKCPYSYCIPIHYVQDEFMDCRYGEDESNEVIIDDVNLRMCLRSHHNVRMCDGQTDCNNLADELDCHSYCAAGFKCQAGIVIVDDYNKSEPFIYLSRFDSSTKVFQLSGVNLSLSSGEEINKFYKLLEVHLSNCNIYEDHLFDFDGTNYRLYKFDASFNNIAMITKNGMLSKLKNLQFLNLSHNTNLTTIDPHGIGSEKIIRLDISYTRISVLPESWLRHGQENVTLDDGCNCASWQCCCYDFLCVFPNRAMFKLSYGIFVTSLGVADFITSGLSLTNRKKLSIDNSSRREHEIDVAKQLFIIAVTNFLCWFPISVLGLMSIKGQIVSQEMYAWLIVFVLPLNSAVNPMIYTVPLIYKKWVEFRDCSKNAVSKRLTYKCDSCKK
ncbi:hypothetical protein Btru_051139 [Bulinus truncatus]|nr:hypothetical protein Btru_051139 [Bulinus truncatus]